MDTAEINGFSVIRLIGFSSDPQVFLCHFIPGMIFERNIGCRPTMKLMKCSFSQKHDRMDIIRFIDSVEKIQIYQPPSWTLEFLIESSCFLKRGSRNRYTITF